MVLQTGGQTGAKAEAVLPRNSSVENFWYFLKQLYYFIISVYTDNQNSGFDCELKKKQLYLIFLPRFTLRNVQFI